ncbi:uncharacterized protein LOC112089259 [Eutrema salsugineum]|uniref:uncharacterized protein LOC112089259 n=1 Tax=Eutrema salsugineum TaxID=72664 RepID=UPI000CED2C99|nr:uncharacterized protein LOC112089259 [Eutrema salsugineum]
MENDEGVNLSRENEENGGDQDDISQTYRMLDIVDPPDCVEEQRIQREWADGLKLRVGAEFTCKQDLIDLVYRGSHKHCFGITVHKSDKKRYYVKYGQAETGCNCYINAAKTAQSNIFTVRVYRKMNSCSRASACTSSKRRKGTSGLVAGVVSKTYPGRLKPPTPRDTMALVQTRGRVEFNPGTTSSVEVDELVRFKYLFVALGPIIEGFAAMRKVIIVDATFLKNGFGGCLVFATAQDPNFHYYPLSFGVVDAEKNDSWNWNVSLINAIRDMYPKAKQDYCIYPLAQNVKVNVQRERKLVIGKFMEVARKCTEAEFLVAYGQLAERYQDAITYLRNSLLEEKWARCYFPEERYNIDTSNCVESMNSVFDDARKYALLSMMDAILSKVSEWSNKHRKEAATAPGAHKLVPYVENVLHMRVKIAQSLNVTELNSFLLEYAVVGGDEKTYLVNLKTKSCSCRCFDIDKYPCVHALAAVRIFMAREDRNEDIHSHDLCSKYYTTELWALAYAKTVYLVPHRSQWVIPDDIKKKTAPKPPEVPKKAGRRGMKAGMLVILRGNANGNTQGNEGRDPNFNASNPEGNAQGYTHGGDWFAYFNCSNPERNTQGGSSIQDS